MLKAVCLSSDCESDWLETLSEAEKFIEEHLCSI
jgi:hypothetical protein